MSQTVLEHLGDGAPSAAWLRSQGDQERAKATAIVNDEKGNPREELTEIQVFQADDFVKRANDYYDAADDAEKTDRSERQAGVRERLEKSGSKITDPGGGDPLNPFGESGKGGDPQQTTKSQLLEQAKSGFAYMLESDEFKSWREENTGADGRIRTGVSKSPSLSLGSAKAFIQGREFVKRTPINSTNTATNRPNFADDGTFIGNYIDAGNVDEQRRIVSILDHVDMITETGGIARWTVQGSPTLQAQLQEEVTDTAALTVFNRKVYSSLGTVARMEVPLRTMAHMFEATTQALQNDAELEATINGLGRRGLVEKLAGELMNGDYAAAGGDTITGLLNTPGVAELSAAGGAAFAVGDSIRKKTRMARAAIKTNRHMPNKMMMNQMTVETWLDEDEVAGRQINRFYNPVTGEAVATLHGITVVETEDVADNRVVMGQFIRDYVRLYNNGEIDAKMTDSHGENFELNLLTWRFEWALAMAVLVPEAFVELHLND